MRMSRSGLHPTNETTEEPVVRPLRKRVPEHVRLERPEGIRIIQPPVSPEEIRHPERRHVQPPPSDTVLPEKRRAKRRLDAPIRDAGQERTIQELVGRKKRIESLEQKRNGIPARGMDNPAMPIEHTPQYHFLLKLREEKEAGRPSLREQRALEAREGYLRFLAQRGLKEPMVRDLHKARVTLPLSPVQLKRYEEVEAERLRAAEVNCVLELPEDVGADPNGGNAEEEEEAAAARLRAQAAESPAGRRSRGKAAAKPAGTTAAGARARTKAT